MEEFRSVSFNLQELKNYRQICWKIKEQEQRKESQVSQRERDELAKMSNEVMR